MHCKNGGVTQVHVSSFSSVFSSSPIFSLSLPNMQKCSDSFVDFAFGILSSDSVAKLIQTKYPLL